MRKNLKNKGKIQETFRKQQYNQLYTMMPYPNFGFYENSQMNNLGFGNYNNYGNPENYFFQNSQINNNFMTMNNNRMGNERNSTDLHQQFASMNIATPVGNLVGDNNQQKTKFFNKSKYNKSF